MLPEAAICKSCELWRGADRQLLVGSGPPNASIMLIGEAPGETENRTGIPFVGESGQLLNTLLEMAGLKRDEVYVSNAVKCRPAKNRTPTAKEIKACRPHLIREVNDVKPDVIIALGNVALKSLCGMSGIMKYRGAAQPLMAGFPPMTAFPTAHPAFALREPNQEQVIVSDITTAVRELRGGFTEIAAPWYTAAGGWKPDMDEPVWSWDIETNAKEMHDPGLRVWFLGIDDGLKVTIYKGEDECRYAALLMSEYLLRVQPGLETPGWLVGHNASAYDRMVMKERFGVNLKTHDTQLLAHRLDESQTLNLQDLAVRHLGVRPWKNDFDVHFWRRGPQTDEEWLDAIEYNARDTRYTRLLFLKFWGEADDLDKRLYRDHNLPASRALSQMQRNGIYVSVGNARKALGEIDVEQRAALLLVKTHTNVDFNPGSAMQVRELFFSDLMLPVQKRTPENDPSTDEESLRLLKLTGVPEPVIDHVLAFRENTKLLTTYIRPYIERATKGYTDKSGFFVENRCQPWLFPSYSMTSTVNDRTSCFNPNLQNVPREKRVRSIVAAPPGYVLCETDFSQLEMRIAAELTGPKCALYQEYLKPNPDVHLSMAERLTRKPLHLVTPEERSDAKPVNFSFLYFADWPTYQRISLVDYGIALTERECRFAQDAFNEWGVRPWWDRIIEEMRATGRVTSIFGAKRRLPNIHAKDPYLRLEAKRMGINFSDASPATHIVQLALTQLVGRGFHVCGYIHDAVHILLPDDPLVIKECVAVIKHDMEVTTPALVEQIFGYRFSLPLPASVKVGLFWGDSSRLNA